MYFFTYNLEFLHVFHLCARVCVCLCVFVCAPMHGCSVICELWQLKCFFMKPQTMRAHSFLNLISLVIREKDEFIFFLKRVQPLFKNLQTCSR